MKIAKSASVEALIAAGAIRLGSEPNEVTEGILSVGTAGLDFPLMMRVDVYTHTTVVLADEFLEFGLETIRPRATLLDLWYVPHDFIVEIPDIYANDRLFRQEFINGVRSRQERRSA